MTRFRLLNRSHAAAKREATEAHALRLMQRGEAVTKYCFNKPKVASPRAKQSAARGGEARRG